MKAVLVISLLLALAASRTFIVETHQVTSQSSGSTDEEFANNLRNDVNSGPQPNGYCSVSEPQMPFNNQGLCGGPNSNIGFRYLLEWSTSDQMTFDFEYGFDFGWGGALFWNGEVYHVDRTDIWWGGSDFNNNDVWRLTFQTISGVNTMEIFGSEGCCDGAHNIRYKVNGGDWKSINDWEEWQSQCCCHADADQDNCTCDGLNWDGSSCYDACYGHECGAQPECVDVTLYEGCYYWGESIELGVDEDCLAWEPKSICVPVHKSVTLYNMCGFEGQSATFEENVACFDEIDYTLLSLNGQKKSLKTAEPLKYKVNTI